MAQKKAHEVDAWLARRQSDAGIVLLYGPDRGLVAERARAYALATGLPLDDPFCVVRLDAAEIDQLPGRLVEEAQTVPMFADRRLIWVRNGGAQKALADDIRALIEKPSPDAVVLIEAGELKKGAALRTMVENAAAAMALPCYADETRAVDAIIDEELQKAGLAIALDAREALRASLGGDRLATRAEVNKLALYCAGQSRVSLDDVRMAVGDAAGLSQDDIVDAVLSGNPERFEASFTRVAGSGQQVAAILGSTLRQMQSLHAMRGAMDAKGQSAAATVASARPPVFFARKRLVEEALQRWSGEATARLAARLQRAVLETRKRPDLAVAIARQVLLGVALDGRRSNRQR